MKVRCEQCGKSVDKSPGHINRAKKAGMRLFCGKACFGLSRRKDKPKAQKVAEKRLYDMEYRRRNRKVLKAKKRAYFERTYDPVRAAKVRKARMPQHVEYCRRPAYKRWKRRYDRHYRAKKMFGPFAESFLLLQKLDREVGRRMTDYEVRQANGTLNKRQERRREYERLISGKP